jgi:hypothetical protein
MRNKDMIVIENLKDRTKQINLKIDMIVSISNKTALIKEMIKTNNEILKIRDIWRFNKWKRVYIKFQLHSTQFLSAYSAPPIIYRVT